MTTVTPRQTWLVGMPDYRLSFAERCVPSVPLGGVETARFILHDSTDEDTFHQRIDDEYRSVLSALLDAGMPFRILNLGTATTPLGARLREERYPAFHIGVPPQGSTYAYPRDLMVYLRAQDIALVSEGWLKPGAGNRDGVECWPTCWSEGGRILMSGECLVVLRHPEKKQARDQPTLNRLRNRGLNVVELPAGIFCALDRDGALTGLFYDPHIDRSAGLVRGHDGGLHLILGPGYRTGPLDAPLPGDASRAILHEACAAANIALHVMPERGPTYAASLVQADDGTVVSSGGGDMTALLTPIVGVENVVETALPLTHFPVFASAGLHCLVTESPEFLLAERAPENT